MKPTRLLAITVWVFLPASTGCGARHQEGEEGKDYRQAVSVISPERLTRNIQALSHDTMMGRYTPSEELDLAAEWVASEFSRIGLSPGGDHGGYLQWYSVRRTSVDWGRSGVRMDSGLSLQPGLDLEFWLPIRFGRTSAPAVLMKGEGDLVEALDDERLLGRHVILWYPPLEAWCSGGRIEALMRNARGELSRLGSLLIATRCEDDAWATQVSSEQERVFVQVDTDPSHVVLRVRSRALMPAVGRAGTELSPPLDDSGFTLLDLGFWTVEVEQSLVEEARAPNVVGIIPGATAPNRAEHVLFSAHLDHLGVAPGGLSLDTVFNGADDNASGVAALLEIAEAAASLTRPLRRGMVFGVVSGEERGLWGSAHLVSHLPVPPERIAAAINLDMVGRNARDSIGVIGGSFTDLGATLLETSAEHPELQLSPLLGTRWDHFFNRSDQFSFAGVGIPSLSFFDGLHEDYHSVTDEAGAVDGVKVARVARLAFFLGVKVASRRRRPRWDDYYYTAVTGFARQHR